MVKKVTMLVIALFLLTVIFQPISTGFGANQTFDKRIIAVAAGYEHTLALASDGSVWTWGNNDYGQLGDGTNVDRNIPVKVHGLTSVIAIAAGHFHSLALKNDGSVWVWGASSNLGNGAKNDSSIPVQVRKLNNITSIGAGFFNSVAIRKDGTVWVWGNNIYSQVHEGLVEEKVPVMVEKMDNAKQATSGLGYYLVVKQDGTLWAWGWNKDTDLGIGSRGDTVAQPCQVKFVSNVNQAFGSSGRIIALISDGTVWRWGSGECISKVPGLDNAILISQGYAFALALKKDGTVVAWGDNDHGQLGNGSLKTSYQPKTVKGLKDIKAIAGGWDHSVAVDKNGDVWAWGANNKGQLGDGTNTNRLTPVKVKFGTEQQSDKVVITNIEKWDHPTKKVFLKHGFTVKKVELFNKKTYPIFYVAKTGTKDIYDQSLIKEIAVNNGYWDFQIVDGEKHVKVFCDKKRKTVVKVLIK